MIIRAQQLLFDLILFVYGLVAIIFAARVVWLTKNKLNEVFQFLLVAVIVWTAVKLLSILVGLRILNIYVVSLGELFFITVLIVGIWYIKHTLQGIKKPKRKTKKRK